MQQNGKPRGRANRGYLRRGTILGEWLRRGSGILWRRDTTRHIGTATGLTDLLAWRVDEDARSRS